jgi:error-prone DNA polymerase
MNYAELHCLSNFSFLRGASHPEELIERAAALGYQALAITDECSVAGVVRAYEAARGRSIKLIVGAEFQLSDGPKLVLLAADRNGYGNLCELITRGRRRAEKGQYIVQRADFADGVPGCLALFVPASSDLEDARWFAGCFGGRGWMAIELLYGSDDRGRLRALRSVAKAAGLPMVAAGDVHMHVRSRRRLQDTLTAIRLGKPVAECGHALYPNAERHLRLRVRLAQIYPPDLLDESLLIASRCTFSLDELRYEYPDEIVPPGETVTTYLRTLVERGLQWRYPDGAPPKVRGQIEHELALIAKLRYEPYFLTVYDVVRFAREQSILCQGRGSAANSAVCYALGITEVDPATSTLLFERFISEERNEPPDIDVDFEHERREEVIQYIYRKYGRDRAAIAATVITYRPRSALRDVGKALGLELEQVDRLAKSQAWWDGRVQEQSLSGQGFDPDSPIIRRLCEMVNTITGFPRHLSQHTGGFVIARGALCRLVPIENAAMPERSVIQWDKDDLDTLGLLKIDVLALGMLTAIRKTIGLMNAFYGRQRFGTSYPFTVGGIPREDPKVYEMIRHADTIGVFQIESRAQMSMLPRLRPAEFYDLVIEVAIVRPGPIQGGMVHPYLRRRQGLEPVVYPSPEVEDVLKRTLGVAIFQEQVMRLAVVAAGFTPGEADRLRRAMAAWRRKGGLEPFQDRLIKGMLERGYTSEFAEQIYRQILGFGEYGFPESHSVSFALLAYQSSWLKCFEPAAFLGGLLNSQPMGFYAPAQLVQDARRHGVEVLPVDVCISEWECALEGGAGAPRSGDATPEARGRPQERSGQLRGTEAGGAPTPAVRLGLLMVKGLPLAAAERIVAARAQQPFNGVEDLARRAGLDAHVMKCLAAADALKPLSSHRRAAYWEVAGIEPPTPLLGDAPVLESVPALAAPSEGESLIADYASVGLTLGRHPLALLRDRLTGMRIATAAQVRQMAHGRYARAAGIVTGRQRPGTASGVVFVTLEDETGYVNVVVWNNVLERQRKQVLGSQLMTVCGRIEREGEVIHLVAQRVLDHSRLLGRLATRSRDFH